jgi:DNA-binding MarR family transcriptional regulator
VVNTTGNAPPGLPAKVLDALGRLARGQRAHRQAVATQHNVTPLQLELLATLAAAPPPDPLVGQLARELAVTQPTITDSLRALDAKGLIARDADPADRRRTTVALTPAGTAIADQLAAADHRLLDAVTSLDPHQQEQVLTSLLDLIAALVDADVIDVARTCTTCHHHQLLPEGTHHCTLLAIDLPPPSYGSTAPTTRQPAPHDISVRATAVWQVVLGDRRAGGPRGRPRPRGASLGLVQRFVTP